MHIVETTAEALFKDFHPATACVACACRVAAGNTMPLHLERCLLLAALLLSATCSTAAADGDDAEPAHFFNKINTTVCTDNACPAGQYAAPTGSSVECKPCPVGSFKGADGKGCCEACKLPELTFNVSNGDFVVFGATGCSKRQLTATVSLLHIVCLHV
jgi:hypothetical protein